MKKASCYFVSIERKVRKFKNLTFPAGEGRPERFFKNHCFLATAVETTLSSAAMEERPLNFMVFSNSKF